MFNFDSRWIGGHGIGRFATELQQRLPEVRTFKSSLSPTNPLDCLLLSWQIIFKRGLFFSPGYNAPVFGLARYVFTVHDLNHIDLPYNSSLLKRLYYRLIIRRACRHCCRVLTVSEYSRQRIIQWSGVAPSQVVNVGNGVDPSFTPEAAPFTPGYPYLLCVSNRKLHKNEPRLLRAFALAKIDPQIRLLFTGNPTDELLDLSRKLGVEARVTFSGFVNESDLPGLYTGAKGLLFPSLYEGFGLPVVEAMACGTPVLTSNTTSLPEVAGDAAILVSPESESEICAGIQRIVQDNELCAELSAKGIERTKLFNWDLVAKRTRAVLEEEIVKYEK